MTWTKSNIIIKVNPHSEEFPTKPHKGYKWTVKFRLTTERNHYCGEVYKFLLLPEIFIPKYYKAYGISWLFFTVQIDKDFI